MTPSFSRDQFPFNVPVPKRPGRWGAVWTDEQRRQAFWARFGWGGVDECWPWLGYVEKQTGYGKFSFDGKLNSAHRFAYMQAFGKIPTGLLVCHKCDNRKCQNPNHLFAGTYTDNNRDMFQKGRGSPPPPRPNITEAQVLQIRAMWKPYEISVRAISKKLNLPYKSVENAVSPSNWIHLTWPNGNPHDKTVLLDKAGRKLKHKVVDGETLEEHKRRIRRDASRKYRQTHAA